MNSRKTFLIISLFLFSFQGFAGEPFTSGDLVVGAYRSIGGKMDVSTYTYMSRVEGVIVDAGIPIRIDSGYFGLGFIYGTRNITKHFDYPISSLGTPYFYDYDWQYKIYGGRLTFHIDLIGIKHLDTYIGTEVTYNQVKFTAHDNLYQPYPPYGTVAQFATAKSNNPYSTMKYPNFMKFSGLFGVRYDIFNFLGIFGEISYGTVNFTWGASIKM